MGACNVESWTEINRRFRDLALKGLHIDVGVTIQNCVTEQDWPLKQRDEIRRHAPGMGTDRHRPLYELYAYRPPKSMVLLAENGNPCRKETQLTLFTKVDGFALEL